MKFISTRRKISPQTASDCLIKGLAPDGGLFVPESFPSPFDLPTALFTSQANGISLAGFSGKLLSPFFAGSDLEGKIEAICRRSYSFPVPLKFLNSKMALLELFHGPTAAFKDVGARFLAECLIDPAAKTVIVATSGDTGGAVAAAFANRPGRKVIILYPKGRISLRQEKQLTSWGPSVRAFAVRSDFDSCQRIVKEALAQSDLVNRLGLISANSISIGRLLPQMAYHAKASVDYMAKTSKQPTIIVPTGNLGNAVGALWAKRLGFPIERVVLATNANRTLEDYFRDGKYTARPTIATLANAMDVSAPSNLERLIDLYPSFENLKKDVAVLSVSDDQISRTIAAGPKKYGELLCPHTATGVFAMEELKIENTIVAATAHPAKFESIVEPLVGQTVPVPPALAEVLERKSVTTEIEPNLENLLSELA